MKPLSPLLPIALFVSLGACWGWQQWASLQQLRPDYELASQANLQPPFLNGLPQNRQCKVKQMLSGDRLDVTCGWQSFQVQLCGIDAPDEGQHLSQASRENLQKLVDGAGGKVEVAFHEIDRSGRQIAEVHANLDTGWVKLLNEEQTAAGMAFDFTQYSDRCLSHGAIANGEEAARDQRLGVWSVNELRPLEYRRVAKLKHHRDG